jgi:hypothetical protein
MQAGERVLEDHPDAPAAQFAEFFRRQSDQITTFEPGLAADLGVAQQADHRLGKHAFSGAGSPAIPNREPCLTENETLRTA